MFTLKKLTKLLTQYINVKYYYKNTQRIVEINKIIQNSYKMYVLIYNVKNVLFIIVYYLVFQQSLNSVTKYIYDLLLQLPT